MVTHSYFPDDPRVARETRKAREAGFEVDVIALRAPHEARTETIDGVKILRLSFQHRRGARPLAFVWEYCGFTLAATLTLLRRSVGHPYAIVHVHNPPDFLVLAAIVPRLRGSRVIFDVHDIASDMFLMRFPALGATPVQRIFQAIERAATSLVDAVITVHEPYRAELARRGTPTEKITVVMNSADETILPPRITRARDDRSFTVAYHGSLTPHYGVELLLDAAAMLRSDVPLKVEIYGSGDALSYLRKDAARRSLSGTVAFFGRLPQAEVLKCVARASAGVVPNLPIRLNHFALSSKLFELVALEIPVACADLPTLRAHFASDEVYFFAAGDANALAGALRAIAKAPEEAAFRARAARRRYERDYAWSTQGGRYLDLLQRLT